MKQVIFTILFTTLLSVVGTKAFAYDIAVENSDGVMIYYNYYNDGTELEVTFKGNYYSYIETYSGEVNIPEEVTYMSRTRKVTSIGGSAFRICPRLTSVTIGNSVNAIGSHAFYGCTGLTSVTIGNSVTTIGGAAFAGCEGLTSVHITDLAAWCNIVFINGSNPLYYAHHLFLNEEEIKDLVIPNSVTTIGDCAFYGCTGLTSVTIGNSVTTIGGAAFAGCEGLTSVHITDLAAWCNIVFINGSNPLYYAHHLFLNEEEIKDLVIPNSVTTIGDCAFYGCTGLISVTIPYSVTTIGRATFASCSSLISVTIPNSVTTIGYEAFSGCKGLTSVTIPNSVTTIEGRAFSYCI